MIVVTGGAGFIGSCLVWKLNEMGREDILVVDHDGLLPPKSDNLKLKKIVDYLDKNDFLKLLAKGTLKDIEAIFHMGACADTTEQNREYLRENNYLYSKGLAEWAVKEGKRFIYASSAATYGDGKQGYSDENSHIPNLKPLNPYGESKQMFDLWVLENKLDSKFVGLKFFNVYGPNEYHKGEMRSMVHKGYNQIKKEGKLSLFKSYLKKFKDGEQKRDFVYIKDVLEVMLWFWNHPDAGGIFNVGTGQAESWNDLGRFLFEAMGKNPRIEYIEMPDNIRDQYQYWTQADLAKSRGVGMNYKFRSLKEGIRDYVQEYLEQANPYLGGSENRNKLVAK